MLPGFTRPYTNSASEDWLLRLTSDEPLLVLARMILEEQDLLHHQKQKVLGETEAFIFSAGSFSNTEINLFMATWTNIGHHYHSNTVLELNALFIYLF